MAASEQDSDFHPGIVEAADGGGESSPGAGPRHSGAPDLPWTVAAGDTTHAGELTAISDQHASDDLLGVVTTLSSTVNIDHVLDQLTTSVDLFGVPTLDLGGIGSDPGDHTGFT